MKKEPVTTEILEKLVDKFAGDKADIRIIAWCLVGFQFRDGAWITIASTMSKLCPIWMIERYMRLGDIRGSSDL